MVDLRQEAAGVLHPLRRRLAALVPAIGADLVDAVENMVDEPIADLEPPLVAELVHRHLEHVAHARPAVVMVAPEALLVARW